MVLLHKIQILAAIIGLLLLLFSAGVLTVILVVVHNQEEARKKMRITKSFKLSLNILLHSKLRSWLTIIGIIIGIAAVVSIISISEGAQQQLESRLGSFGADIITITPGFSRAQGPGGFGRGDFGGETSTATNSKNLTSKDVLILKNLPNIRIYYGANFWKSRFNLYD